MRRPVAFVGVVTGGLALFASGCLSGGAEVDDAVPTFFDDSTSTVEPETTDDTSSTTASTTIPIVERLPALADEVAGAVRSADGSLLPITGTDGDVWFVLGPCGDEQIEPGASAVVVGAHHVMLDPGAAAVSLAVAEKSAALLRSDGVVVALTHTGSSELSARTRSAVGPAVGAAAFVSIHHPVADGSETGDVRPSVVHRADHSESRRLAGLIHEEVVAAFAGLSGSLATQNEAGVYPLLNQRGDDYYRVLQLEGGGAGARVDLLAFGENETTLLTTEEGRDIEAQALADAIVRFLITEEEGNGFINPIEAVRTAPTSNTPGGCG